MDEAEQAHLEKKLVIAQQHVDEGERLIERQRKSIEERQRDGHDNALANDLLAELAEAQRVQIEHRDLIRRELAIERGEQSSIAPPH